MQKNSSWFAATRNIYLGRTCSMRFVRTSSSCHRTVRVGDKCIENTWHAFSATSGSAPRSLPWPNQKLCTEHQCGKVRWKLQTLHFLDSRVKKLFLFLLHFPFQRQLGALQHLHEIMNLKCAIFDLLLLRVPKIGRKRKWHLHCENFKSGWCLASANLASFGSWTLGCQCCSLRTWKCPSAIGAKDS